MRYESSTLILCKELSSSIFQSLSVRHAWHPSRSPLCAICKDINALYWPSIINYQLLPPHSVLYWPSTQLHHLVTHSWTGSSFHLILCVRGFQTNYDNSCFILVVTNVQRSFICANPPFCRGCCCLFSKTQLRLLHVCVFSPVWFYSKSISPEAMFWQNYFNNFGRF